MDPFGMGGIQAQLKAVQEEAGRAEVEGTAGGGLVVVRMNGNQEVLAVRVDRKVLGDGELLEDLVRAATNDAVRRSREAQAEAMRAFAARLGLPPGLLGL